MSDFTYEEHFVISAFFENEIRKLESHIPNADAQFEKFVVEQIEFMRTLYGKVLAR